MKFAVTPLLLAAVTGLATAKTSANRAPDVPNPLASRVQSLPAVKVDRARLVRYNLWVLPGPKAGEAHLFLHRPFGNPVLGVIWCDPGHAGDEIMAVNGEPVVPAQYRHWIQVIDSAAPPMRLAVRSKYGVVANLETSDMEPGDPTHSWAPAATAPRWHPPEARPNDAP